MSFSKPQPALMPVPQTPIDAVDSSVPAPSSSSAPGSLYDAASYMNSQSGQSIPFDEELVPTIESLPPPTVLSNPGAWDKCDGEAQRALKPDTFDGVKLELQKGLSPNFATSHSIALGSSMHESGGFYSFGSTLVLGEGVLIGRIDNNFRMDAQWHQPYNAQWMHHIQASVAPPGSALADSHFVSELECKGAHFTGGLKAALTDGLMLGGSYFQAVTPRLALGGEGMYHDGRRSTNIALRARYTDNNHTLVATASTAGNVGCTLSRRVNRNALLAAEIDLAPLSLNSYMSFGCELLLRQAKFTANVSGNGLIQATLQEYLYPGASLNFSAIVNHRKNLYRFGVGVSMG